MTKILKINEMAKSFTLKHGENEDTKLCDMFCGLDISEVKNQLGYRWILDTQNVKTGSENYYVFSRAGQGSIKFITNQDNVVIDCQDLGRNW